MQIRPNYSLAGEPFLPNPSGPAHGPGNSGQPPQSASLTLSKQNRYESIFIKLFAQLTLRLLAIFGIAFAVVLIARELLAFQLSFLRVGFWIKVSIVFVFLAAVVFARIKVMTSIPVNGAPWSAFVNNDQMVSLLAWTLASYQFGSWYMGEFAPDLTIVFDAGPGKGMQNVAASKLPVVRESYYLICMVLFSQGFVLWIASLLRRDHELFKLSSPKHTVFHHLKLKFASSSVWIQMAQQASLVYLLLCLVHVFVAWFGFPIFSRLIGLLIPVQDCRHSWLALFRFNLLIHSFTFSFTITLLQFVMQSLLDFFLSTTLRVSSAVGAKDSDGCLALGLTSTAHPYIHYHAVAEFSERFSGPKASPLRRRSLFSSALNEVAVTRAICEWFAADLRRILDRCECVSSEFSAFDAVLSDGGRGHLFKDTETDSSISLDERSPLYRYKQQTSNVFEVIARRILGLDSRKLFEPSATSTTTATVLPSSAQPPIPEIFVPRRKAAPADKSGAAAEFTDGLPIMVELGPFLLKAQSFGGGLLISLWIAARFCACVGHLNERLETVRSMSDFIIASYEEDEQGQVQRFLPRLLETMVDVWAALDNVLSLPKVQHGTRTEWEQAAAEDVQVLKDELKVALQRVYTKFGDSLMDLKPNPTLLDRLSAIISN